MSDEAERKRCDDMARACVRHDGDDACYEPVCDICDRDVARITALLIRERAAVRDESRAEVERLTVGLRLIVAAASNRSEPVLDRLTVVRDAARVLVEGCE